MEAILSDRIRTLESKTINLQQENHELREKLNVIESAPA
jgi:hypothetical protein